jgi:sigma-70-like protein
VTRLPKRNRNPVDERLGSELIERLYAAIRQLPKVDASLALMHLDGLSYEEMSEVLGISENYIGVKLIRIRKQLGRVDLHTVQHGADVPLFRSPRRNSAGGVLTPDCTVSPRTPKQWHGARMRGTP